MAIITDLEKERKRLKKRRFWKNVLLLLLFAAIVYGLAFISTQWGNVGLRAAFSEIAAEIQTGDGFPVQLRSGSLMDLLALDDAILTVYDSDFSAYNETGHLLSTMTHGTANTAYTAAGDYALFFDRGDKRANLFTRSSQTYSHTSDFTIIDGDVASNGIHVLATSSQMHLAQASAYTRQGENLFTWYSDDQPVVCVSLSDSGQYVVTGSVTVENGFYSSSLSLFSLLEEEDQTRVVLPDTLILDLDFSSGNRLWALTDRGVLLFDQKLQELAFFSLQGQGLQRFFYDPQQGDTVLLLDDYSGQGQGEIVILDQQLSVSHRWFIQSEPVDIRILQGYVFVIEKDHFVIYNTQGDMLQRQSASGMEKLCIWRGMLYYAAAGTLYQIPLP